jgi:hypothetical protein
MTGKKKGRCDMDGDGTIEKCEGNEWEAIGKGGSVGKRARERGEEENEGMVGGFGETDGQLIGMDGNESAAFGGFESAKSETFG